MQLVSKISNLVGSLLQTVCYRVYRSALQPQTTTHSEKNEPAKFTRLEYGWYVSPNACGHTVPLMLHFFFVFLLLGLPKSRGFKSDRNEIWHVFSSSDFGYKVIGYFQDVGHGAISKSSNPPRVTSLARSLRHSTWSIIRTCLPS